MELKHLNNEQLVDYFAGVWTRDQERMIEVHMAGCEECSRSARQIYAEIEVFDRWSVQNHSETNVLHEVVEQEYGRMQTANQHGMLVRVARAIGTFAGRLSATRARQQEHLAQQKSEAAEYRTRNVGS